MHIGPVMLIMITSWDPRHAWDLTGESVKSYMNQNQPMMSNSLILKYREKCHSHIKLKLCITFTDFA